ncbi:MAG: hypothetical protein ACE148_06625 [Vicinamibacterales bacterium]
MRSRVICSRVLFLVLASGFAFQHRAGMQDVPPVTVDRVLAVVDGAVITLSDIRASIALGLVKLHGGTDPIRQALDRAIERQLMLNEVERYSAPEPEAEYVDLRLASIRARFSSSEAFDLALTRAGLDVVSLRARLRDDLRIEQYMRDRFSAVIQPTDEETRRYYGENQAEFTRDGQVLPYDAVVGDVRERIVERRKGEVTADWLERLRRRAIVTDIYSSREGPGGRLTK